MSILGRMETPEAAGQPIHREQQLMARLQLTTIHLNDTQQERIWAMVAAYKVSASIQQIAATAGLSSNQLHQFCTTGDAQAIPVWLSQFPEHCPITPSGGVRDLALGSRLAGMTGAW
jgi:hypothetical protein